MAIPATTPGIWLSALRNQVGSPNWNFMNRKTEAIWETNSVPSGPLQFRVVVTAGLEGKWYWASKVMPEDWRNGEIYDTGLHITDTSIMDTIGEL
nr:expansin-like A2 [Ipomoea batatas]